MSRKTAPKTARAPGRPFAKGRDARRGAGKKGRSGRRPLKITEAAREIFEREDLLTVAATIASSPKEKASDRLAAIRFVADYAYGKPKQTLGLEADAPATFTLNLSADEPSGDE